MMQWMESLNIEFTYVCCSLHADGGSYGQGGNQVNGLTSGYAPSIATNPSTTSSTVRAFVQHALAHTSTSNILANIWLPFICAKVSCWSRQQQRPAFTRV